MLSTPNVFQWIGAKLAFAWQGRTLKRDIMRAAAELAVQQASADVGRITERLVNGLTNVREWESEMQAALKRLHCANAALARGGWQQMAPANWRRVEETLRFHYPYLRGFAQDVAAGKVSERQILGRAQRYVLASRGTYENERLELHKERGFAEARRVLAGSVAHCSTCAEEAAKGWQPIDEMLPIGDAECRAACNCAIVHR
jgi:hypothetical protein